MKNKYLSFVAMAAAAFATSCSSDNFATESGHPSYETETVTLEASIGNGDGTRVGMGRKDGKVQLYWHKDEIISVQTKSRTDDTSFSNTLFEIAESIETGATKATFTGTVKTGYDVGSYALYPYNYNHKFTSTGITYHLNEGDVYTLVEGNIFSKTTDGKTTYPTNSTCMPMLGTIEEGKIKFQYIGGLIVIRIDKMPATDGYVIVSADQKLWGDFAISDPTAEKPEISTGTATTDDEKKVVFSYLEATKGGVGVFYLPLATGSYTNLKISVGGYADNLKTVEYGSLNVSRADVITIPVYQSEDGTSYSCDYVVNGHKFVDLCLPSGTLWAETNVGATTAADNGNYYAWGEVETKSDYSWDTYKHGKSSLNLTTKYNSTDGNTILDKEDDAAYMNWGSYCRMPTNDELNELINNSTWTWNGDKKGCEVKSKKNGNSIFLPASGCRYGKEFELPGTVGCWSSSLYLNNSYGAYRLYSYGSDQYSFDGNRFIGFSVRPVAKKPGYELYNDGDVDNMEMNEFDDSWK